MAPPPPLPYKVDTSRPSLRTNWTRLPADRPPLTPPLLNAPSPPVTIHPTAHTALPLLPPLPAAPLPVASTQLRHSASKDGFLYSVTFKNYRHPTECLIATRRCRCAAAPGASASGRARSSAWPSTPRPPPSSPPGSAGPRHTPFLPTRCDGSLRALSLFAVFVRIVERTSPRDNRAT